MGRLVPSRQLPPYSYVAGLFPHPVSHPAGHMYGAEKALVAFEPSAWWECEEYLFGFDLFNAGYYWEAHEAWEAVWHALGRKGPAADVVKGLIRLAACGVKARERKPDGVTGHAAGAARLFGEAAEHGATRLGFYLPKLQRLAAGACPAPGPKEEPPVRVVFPFALVPLREQPERPVPPLRIPDDRVVEIMRRKSAPEKLLLLEGMWRFARDMMRANVARDHPEYDEKQARREAARRLAGGHS